MKEDRKAMANKCQQNLFGMCVLIIIIIIGSLYINASEYCQMLSSFIKQTDIGSITISGSNQILQSLADT